MEPCLFIHFTVNKLSIDRVPGRFEFMNLWVGVKLQFSSTNKTLAFGLASLFSATSVHRTDKSQDVRNICLRQQLTYFALLIIFVTDKFFFTLYIRHSIISIYYISTLWLIDLCRPCDTTAFRTKSCGFSSVSGLTEKSTVLLYANIVQFSQVWKLQTPKITIR